MNLASLFLKQHEEQPRVPPAGGMAMLAEASAGPEMASVGLYRNPPVKPVRCTLRAPLPPGLAGLCRYCGVPPWAVRGHRGTS